MLIIMLTKLTVNTQNVNFANFVYPINKERRVVMTFYEVYVRLCNDKGKTPSSVATDIGLSKAMVSRWKKGGSPSDATLIKVADYFGLSPTDLHKMEAEEKKPVTSEGDRLSEKERQIIMMLRDAPPDLRTAAVAAALAVLRSRQDPG